MWHVYYSPTSVEDVLRLLGEHGPDARIIAGGTDLIVELQRGVRQARVLIDITRIGGLNQVRLEDDGLHVGPMVTHNQALTSDMLMKHGYPLVLACWRVGTPQLRNRGTIVGNLVTGSPANDTICALLALDARLTLCRSDGERTLPLADFYRGVRETALGSDEMVTDVVFPPMEENQRGAFSKLALRRVHAISVVNAAAVLTFDAEVVTRARIALGSVSPTVTRASEAESSLLGREMDHGVIETAAELAAEATSCIDDIRAGAGYRQQVVKVLVRRLLSALREGDERQEFPDALPMLWGGTRGSSPRLAGKTICHRHKGLEPIECTVNGENVVVQGANNKTLLDMLREDVGLTGAKEGCGEGECGACTVWMDGISILACLTPAPRAHGSRVITIEGLAEGEELHQVQQAFVDEGAVQCGYCTPGFVMAAASLLEEVRTPSREQIEIGLSGNLCRCTGYHKIIRAVEAAAGGDSR